MSDLNCYKSQCEGAMFKTSDDAVLLRCGSCGAVLEDNNAIRTLAQDNGAVAQLASLLVDKGAEAEDSGIQWKL